MTVNDSDTDVRRELLEYLEYQRASVRSIVDGLNEDAWHTPVVASGWTVAGVVEHLGGAEREQPRVGAGGPVLVAKQRDEIRRGHLRQIEPDGHGASVRGAAD